MPETRRTPVFTRYELLEKLGSGGMGTVYKARQKYVGRLVAFKVLPPALRNDAEALQRFEREAGALGRLNHPNVVGVSDAGVEGGFPYLAMELVEGQDLRKILQKQHRLSVDEVIKLGAEMAEALDHIYQQGIVHRDVKPSNIIIRPDGQAVLTDFGEAIGATLPRLTQRGVLIGTFEYMSPEQVAGKELDGLSDLYSLGVVLYECLTGEVPFPCAGESPTEMLAMLKRIQEEPVPTIRRADMPPWLADVLARCLKKKSEDRFPDGKALAKALRVEAISESENDLESTADTSKSRPDATDELPKDRFPDGEGLAKALRVELPSKPEVETIEVETTAAEAETTVPDTKTAATETGTAAPEGETTVPETERVVAEVAAAPRVISRVKHKRLIGVLMVLLLLAAVGYGAVDGWFNDPEYMAPLTADELPDLPQALRDKIGNLTPVDTLDLSFNQLKTVPESITRWTNLKGLDLEGNQLTTVPESISQLTSLNVLDLSWNQLKTVPESITRLTNLKGLDLKGNLLTTVPKSISQLTSLNVLDLSWNQLKTVPESISQLTKLKTLTLQGNPIPQTEIEKIRRLLPNTEIKF